MGHFPGMLNNQRVLETLKDTQIMYGPLSENGSLPGPMAYPLHWNRHKMVVINPFGWYEYEMGNIHINISTYQHRMGVSEYQYPIWVVIKSTRFSDTLKLDIDMLIWSWLAKFHHIHINNRILSRLQFVNSPLMFNYSRLVNLEIPDAPSLLIWWYFSLSRYPPNKNDQKVIIPGLILPLASLWKITTFSR